MNPRRVSPVEAGRLIDAEGYLYIDVRSESEFELGHPMTAYNVPLRTREHEQWRDNADFIEVMRACFPRTARLVIGCERGERSSVAAALLAREGYLDVTELHAGFGGRRDPFGRVIEAGWRAAGLPCSLEAPPERTYAALLARMRASLGE